MNENGTTWVADTLYVSFSLESEPPSSDFDLLEPADGAVGGIPNDLDANLPIHEEFTFHWDAAQRQSGDGIF